VFTLLRTAGLGQIQRRQRDRSIAEPLEKQTPRRDLQKLIDPTTRIDLQGRPWPNGPPRLIRSHGPTALQVPPDWAFHLLGCGYSMATFRLPYHPSTHSLRKAEN
jgi:hypothetical protein